MIKHHLPYLVCSSIPLPLLSPLVALGVVSGFAVVVLLLLTVNVGCGCLVVCWLSMFQCRVRPYSSSDTALMQLVTQLTRSLHAA